MDYPDHGEDGFHTVRCVRPMLLPYSFDFPGQLKNWLRVQGFHPEPHCFGQQVILCGTRSQPQDCRSLLNVLLDVTGFSRCFSINSPRYASFSRMWDVDGASNEFELILLSGYPEAIGIPGLLDAIGLDAVEELCRKKRRWIHRCWSRHGHTSFFFLILYPLRHCGAAYQAEIVGAGKRAEMADIEQVKKIVPFVTWKITCSQQVCELVLASM